MKSELGHIRFKLRRNRNILAVYIFGSFVSGKKRPSSDLDIAIILNRPCPALSQAKQSLKLYESLLDIFAPLAKNNRQLDLVFLQKTSLSLQKQVLLQGKLIYCQNKQKLSQYKENTLLKYADIKPVLDRFYQDVYTTRL